MDRTGLAPPETVGVSLVVCMGAAVLLCPRGGEGSGRFAALTLGCLVPTPFTAGDMFVVALFTCVVFLGLALGARGPFRRGSLFTALLLWGLREGAPSGKGGRPFAYSGLLLALVNCWCI